MANQVKAKKDEASLGGGKSRIDAQHAKVRLLTVINLPASIPEWSGNHCICHSACG